ncbi:MAG: CoA activase, partial [Coriobacteriaceae bacterium]|nr:CoA activase [Coriobacteriaceae bacterium]
MRHEHLIGIDARSKTIKIVVLDEDGRLVCAAYRRHRSDIRENARELLHDLVWRYGDLAGPVCVTGSAGIGLSHLLGLPFVQEVVATTCAVREKVPEADAFIELGGEDAKVVYLSGGLEQRMNATCAGGTGGFIDTMAFMLGVRTHEMSSLALAASHIHPIASRCAVFAQTDVRPLLNAGARKSDIAASVLEAVVRQTIGGLACGRPLSGTIVFLGGPLEHVPDLVTRFRRALGLSRTTGIKPPDAHLFTALGAALLAPDQPNPGCGGVRSSLSTLERAIQAAPFPEYDRGHLPPLFLDEEGRQAFKERHRSLQAPRARLFDCRGPLYLGIDAGSTTVKTALVDGDGALVYSDYQPTKGDSLDTATAMLDRLLRALPHEYGKGPLAWIGHAVVTGYGESLLKAAFQADSGMVETMAHLRAARELCPHADLILDIGGQDMKALWVKDGRIVDAVLNEACSSGCGAFLEGTAHALGLAPTAFAELALTARTPLDLGMKCTVFMTSLVRHAQKAGASKADIAAGLAYSLVKNALFKIIRAARMEAMGSAVVVQGGAFMSDAVLRAFELVSGRTALRPDIA